MYYAMRMLAAYYLLFLHCSHKILLCYITYLLLEISCRLLDCLERHAPHHKNGMNTVTAAAANLRESRLAVVFPLRRFA